MCRDGPHFKMLDREIVYQRVWNKFPPRKTEGLNHQCSKATMNPIVVLIFPPESLCFHIITALVHRDPPCAVQWVPK